MNKKCKTRGYGWGFGAFRQFWVALSFGKLKSKQTGPYLIIHVFPHGAVELKTKEGVWFKVNGEQIKLYFGHTTSVNEVIEAYHLDEG